LPSSNWVSGLLRRRTPSERRAMVHFLKQVLPDPFLNLARVAARYIFRAKALVSLTWNYFYDFQRFSKWSAMPRVTRLQQNQIARITASYHRIEKGLSLKSPRAGFANDHIMQLIDYLIEYKSRYGTDAIFCVAVNALLAYQKFNKENGVENTNLDKFIMELSEDRKYFLLQDGGVLPVLRSEIIKDAKKDLRYFFKARHSIRNFSSKPVDIDFIRQAVEMARQSPSVCNRQSWRVYVYSDPADKERVLKFQNGNRGFGEQIDKVLLVTSDLQTFLSVGERNQCWIDGGMFSMSLVYALHSLGLGTCCLNLNVLSGVDLELRKKAKVGESESMIMMIAVGHIPDQLLVAQSHRKAVDEILILR